VKIRYIPERGDIVDVNFDPTRGKEQAHDRPALVLSVKRFNKHTGLALLAPVTSTIRGHGFEVPVNSGNTKGVVLTHQMRMIDYSERYCTLRGQANAATVKEALSKVRAIVA